jgi:hypothetical protein
VAHPHSPQPFPLFTDTGTAALSRVILSTPPHALRSALERLARAPTRAACAFEAANVVAGATHDFAATLSHFKLDVLRMAAARDPLPTLNDPTLPYNAVLESRATLVVAPAGIIRQWAEELRRWCPRLAVVTYLQSLSFRPPEGGISAAAAVAAVPWYSESTRDWRCDERVTASNRAPLDVWQLRWLAAIAAADVVLAPFEALEQELKVAAPPPPPPDAPRPVYKCPRCSSKLLTISGFVNHSRKKHAAYVSHTEAAALGVIPASAASAAAASSSADAAAAATPAPAVERFTSRGLLLSVFWHRIVLDEVQQLEAKGEDGKSGVIATASAPTAGARLKNAVELQAAHRWAVSGTPMDSLFDVGATLRFLRHQPFGHAAWFNAVLRPAFNDSSRLAGVRAGAKALQAVTHELRSAIADFKAVYASTAELRPASLRLEAAALAAEACIEPFAPAKTAAYLAGLFAAARTASAGSVFSRNFVFDSAPALEQRKRLPSNKRCEFYERELLPLLRTVDSDRALREATSEHEASLAAVHPIVARCGTQYSLLSALLRPILWRNTHARVGAASLPPVTQALVRVEPTAGERALLTELSSLQRSDEVRRLRAAIAVRPGGRGGVSALPPEVFAAVERALARMRGACCHMAAAGDGALEALNVRGSLARTHCASLSQVSMSARFLTPATTSRHTCCFCGSHAAACR